MNTVPQIDRTALKFNQMTIVVLLLAGFIFNERILPLFVAFVMCAGSVIPGLSLFKQFYALVLRPAGIMKAEVSDESPAPHNFAQLLGGIFLGGGTLLLSTGFQTAGWALTWLVIILAGVNLVFGFCAGCFLYYQLGKFGFFRSQSPEEGRQ